MSIRIMKAGLLDTLQDEGRYGYQHLGINPGGVMDIAAMKTANALVGNPLTEMVIEMHYPAAKILFEADALIAVSGGDFGAHINNDLINGNQPVIIKKNSTLAFKKLRTGARTYVAVKGGFAIDKWLHSASTNLKAQAGGFDGRALRKGDLITLNEDADYASLLNDANHKSLPWHVSANDFYSSGPTRFIAGAEFDLLTPASKKILIEKPFSITNESDRMGYRLLGQPLVLDKNTEVISSAVTRGTLQLLPNGQLIILMADHQTTGGYPRIGHVISADLSRLAQKSTLGQISFSVTGQQAAEQALFKQYLDLLQLQNACNFRLQQYLK